jgi:hypothetical protein
MRCAHTGKSIAREGTDTDLSNNQNREKVMLRPFFFQTLPRESRSSRWTRDPPKAVETTSHPVILNWVTVIEGGHLTEVYSSISQTPI